MTGLATLTAALGHPNLPGIAITPPTVPSDARRAAVLILLTDQPDPMVTLVERSPHLRNHAGQIAFPGGAVDDTDASDVAAALRETYEEIGLPADQVRVLGQLRRAWVPVSGFAVTPIVGSWDGVHAVRPMHAAEVAAIHRVHLGQLADPATRVSSRHPGGYVGPAFVIGDLFIWGFTAHLLSWVLDLGKWSRPWDEAHLVDVPRRFQRDNRFPTAQ